MSRPEDSIPGQVMAEIRQYPEWMHDSMIDLWKRHPKGVPWQELEQLLASLTGHQEWIGLRQRTGHELNLKELGHLLTKKGEPDHE